MAYGRFGLVMLVLCCTVTDRAVLAQVPGFDLVTMKNGEIHNGTVAHEAFSFATGFGILSVPYGRMARLEMSGSPHRLVTRSGDTFTGRLRDSRVTMLRTLDTILPLAAADIAEVSFAERPLRRRTAFAPDAVETGAGDRFFGWIALDELMLSGASARQTVRREDIHLIDFNQRDDEDQPVARVWLNGGDSRQGLVELDAITVTTRYGGQTLAVPIADLSRLAFRVGHSNTRPDFHHRRRIRPSTLIRDRMVDGTGGPEMIALRGGSFVRGDADGDTDEKPPVLVRPKPFAMGMFEVTFAEYDRFCDDTHRDKPEDSGWGRGPRPVINVTWNDAVAYTEWLSRRTRQTYRLPTDAEWEYAARASTRSRFWWGDEPGVARANCEGCGSVWDGDKTAPVGRFDPNPFGLHDTAGNVFEWVADCFHDSYAEAPPDGTALDKPGCGKRVIRGGGWSFPPHEMRSANRWRDFPTRSSDDTGFRIVRELE